MTVTNETIVSKVLILDSDASAGEQIRDFCDAHNLVALKTQSDHLMGVLKSNVDLGAIFLSENYDGKDGFGLILGAHIHALRPELPIFLRRDAADGLQGLTEVEQKSFSVGYKTECIESLIPALDQYLFSITYPNALVRGITEITKSALESQFKNLSVEVDRPYVVRDRIIHGEIFTLIPIEGSWCRGYMMLQSDEFDLMNLVKQERTHIARDGVNDFRSFNAVLGEITNLIWGSFKNRYITSDIKSTHIGQVPIIVNHLHKYISFGSENPQLCFKYQLNDKDSNKTMLEVHQRFVFNLNWQPEDFSENVASVEDLMDSGELEMF